MGILNCIFVIIGVIIGAGFASGKEIYTFFYIYGWYGIIGILLSASLIGYIIYKTLRIIKEYNIKNYDAFLDVIIGNVKIKKIDIRIVLNFIINTFLLITFFTMCAGFASYFKQEIGINEIILGILVATFCFLLLNKDIKGVFILNSILIPIVIIILIVLGIKGFDANLTLIKTNVNNINWVLYAILYASYNTITLTSILIPIKEKIKTKREVIVLSLICTFIIILLALIIFELLINAGENIETLDLPTVYSAGKIGIFYKHLYGVILLFAIVTTAISSAYSFLNNVSKTKKAYRIYNAIICIISIFVSLFGFSNLVNYLYPIFGFLGLIQLMLIVTKNLY